MKTFDLYGIKNNDLENARTLIEKILDFKFVAHESSYFGGVYYRYNNVGEEHFILQKNFDLVEDEWFEDKHKNIKILFYVNETNRSRKIKETISSNTDKVVLLRHKIIE